MNITQVSHKLNFKQRLEIMNTPFPFKNDFYYVKKQKKTAITELLIFLSFFLLLNLIRISDAKLN